MAYSVKVACDKCGENPFFWTNQTITMKRAMRLAKNEGWLITRNGNWYCTECGETVRRAEIIVYGEPLD